jgi:hypothetical protein
VNMSMLLGLVLIVLGILVLVFPVLLNAQAAGNL